MDNARTCSFCQRGAPCPDISKAPRLVPAPAVLFWFEEVGFVPTAVGSDSWEIARAASLGYGWLTLRFWPSDFGYCALVETGQGQDRRCVEVGLCATLTSMQRLFECLWPFQGAEPISTAHGLHRQANA